MSVLFLSNLCKVLFNICMKNKLLLVPFIPLLFTLTACPFSFEDNDEWKEKYGTPELFLENIEGHAYVYMYEKEGQYSDSDFVIRNLIKESGPFESIEKRNPTADRYFTYEGYWQPATSGPNYCNMSIWDDGLIRIDHKKSLGSHKYLYFSMDADKAANINNFVFEKLSSIL